MKIGDDITYVSRSGFLFKAKIWRIETPYVYATPPSSEATFRIESEGVSWIRGWHDKNSDEERALLVANALIRGETL